MTALFGRTFMAPVATALLPLVVLVPVSRAVAQGDTRVELIGPAGNFHCGTGGDIVGDPSDVGFVVINQVGDVVRALVVLRNLEPGATYAVRLVQISEDQGDCHLGEHLIVTDRRGRATVRLVEPILGATGFQVSVNAGHIFGSPHWVASRTVPAE